MNHNPGMSSRWTGFFVWALVAACVAFWGLKIFAATHPVPAGALTPVPPVATAGPMVRLFGATAAPEEADDSSPAESDRFQLVGVIAPRAGSQGIAIVAVDNQPPKAWRVGAALEGDTTLLGVAKRSAEFGPTGGPAAFTLELPAPQPPQTGTLPVAQSQPPGGVPVRNARGGIMPPQARANEGFAGLRPGMRLNPGERPGLAQPGMIQGGNGARPAPLGGQTPPAQPDANDSSDNNSDE